MERINKINKLKEELKKEQAKSEPDNKRINDLMIQIANFGIGLDFKSFLKKPFTNV